MCSWRTTEHITVVSNNLNFVSSSRSFSTSIGLCKSFIVTILIRFKVDTPESTTPKPIRNAGSKRGDGCFWKAEVAVVDQFVNKDFEVMPWALAGVNFNEPII